MATATPRKIPSLLGNSGALLAGTLASKALGLLGVLLLSRYLGVEGFGRYSLVLSLVGLLNTLVDMGGTALLSRELAARPDETRLNVESALYLRLVCGLVLFPVVIVASPHLGVGLEQMALVLLGVLCMSEALIDAYFGAKARLNLSALTRFVSSLVNLALVFALVHTRSSWHLIVLATVCAPLSKLAVDLFVLPRISLLPTRPQWQRIGKLALEGWPLWFMGLQYVVMARVDTVLLANLSPNGDHDLGIYSAAVRLSEVLALLITALSPAILPLLVRGRATEDSAKSGTLIDTAVRVVLAILIPLSLGIFWYAPAIIQLCYGYSYWQSAHSLRALIGSQPLVAINTLAWQVLLVHNVQGKRPLLIASVLNTLLNIWLNLLWIPAYTSLGSSLATLATEAAASVSLLFFVWRYTGHRLTGRVLSWIALGLACLLPPVLLGEAWGILSPALFLALVFGLRWLTVEEVKAFANERPR